MGVVAVGGGMKQKIGRHGNHETWIDGIRFASKKEARWWLHYKELERRGEISNLQRQVKFYFEVNGVKIRYKSKIPLKYIADFVFEEKGVQVVVDAKGYRTDMFKLKSALMKYINGIEVVEV